jgi:hypothetical protein
LIKINNDLIIKKLKNDNKDLNKLLKNDNSLQLTVIIDNHLQATKKRKLNE